MKKSLYFQHDYNARNDPKLQDVLIAHGVAGLGVFWCIVEQLYEQDGTLALKSCKSIAYALHAKVAMVESVVKDYGLFENDGENFWSDSILRRLSRSKNIAAQRKAAALVRWKSEREGQPGCNCNANAKQEQCKTAVNKCINKEEKESEKKSVQRFVPPTVAEVQAYIQKKGYSIDAESFVAFYESKGWMVGKNKMKDWHMALVTWSKRPQYNQTRSSTTRNCNDEWK